MNLVDIIFGKKMDEAGIMFDLDLLEEGSRSVMLKKTAIDSVLSKIAHKVAEQNIIVKNDKNILKDSLYYRMNVMPNRNQSKHEFIYNLVMKLLQDGECLVIQTSANDLIIADSFEVDKKAVYENVFRNVTSNDFTFERTFTRDEVLYFKYSNNGLDNIMQGLYHDYGELLGRMIEFQLRKSQLRATVNIDSVFANKEGAHKRIQGFVDRLYSVFKKNAVAIIPQQKGLEYEEHSKATGTVESVDEVKKVKNQYMYEVARAVGYPIAFLNGDIADLSDITKNYYKECVSPIIAIIENEFNKQLFTTEEYLSGERIKINRPTTRDEFDLLRSGAINGNDLRESVGLERANDPMLEEYYTTKDYKEISKGGDDE